MTNPTDLIERPCYGTWFISETPLMWCRELLKQHFDANTDLLKDGHFRQFRQNFLSNTDLLKPATAHEPDPLLAYVDEVTDLAVMTHHSLGEKRKSVFHELAAFRSRAKEIIAALQAMRTDNFRMKLLIQDHFTAFASSLEISYWGLSPKEKGSYSHELLRPLAVLRDDLFWGWSKEKLESYFDELKRLRGLPAYELWRAHAVATGDGPSEEEIRRLEDELEVFSTWDSLTVGEDQLTKEVRK